MTIRNNPTSAPAPRADRIYLVENGGVREVRPDDILRREAQAH